ncbi:tripartite motif-containing protein 16-like [Cololabis saira]|uniref:tripartite motif-containing protein 16-like n=1 Tax=Cololabis saira TaxID=129043 RepID=UPI002AD58D08|nr:tripartite motif-containing protein 16-like [Cololabis saira]
MAEARIPVSINHLSCQICSKLLRDPVTIPCGHNFCRHCISDCWDRGERKCICPQCRREFTPRPHLIMNSTLAQMVRDTGRSEKRKEKSSAGSPEASKKPRSCTETSGSNWCTRHQRPLNGYCCTDHRVICSLCASAEHGGHTIARLEEARRKKQGDLRTTQKQLQQILQEQEEKWENLGKMAEQVQEEARQAEDYCESAIVRVIDCLQKHYLSVRELIRAQEEAAAAQVHISLQNLEMKMEEIKKTDAELDSLAQTESSVHFLEDWPHVRRQCEKHHLQPSHELSEDQIRPFEATKTIVEQLGKQLEEFCDKELASISHTGLSGAHRILNEKEVEPKIREDFLRYACELSLDPTTAHKDLTISEGDKKVMFSPHTNKTPAFRHPESFTTRLQVLCREGLQAERCYYEVEIQGEKVEIALAYKGLNRKSRTQLSAFGGNANSWSLDRSKTYSVSHRGDSVQLTTPPSQSRVGVYLKFKEGTLSYYEVTDSMKFLYKVEATFTEPLHPGFWLGENSCIRICDLRQDAL